MPAMSTPSRRISVAHLGPDPAGGGGMAAVIRGLFASSLAERFDLEMIVTYRSNKPLARFGTFFAAVLKLIAWSLRRGPRIAHVHSAVRGSLYRKSVCVFLLRALRQPVLLHIHAGMGDIEAFEARLDPLRRWVFHRALRAATLVLAVSGESARMMERCFGVAGIAVVPNAAPALPEGALEGEGAPHPGVLYLGGFANPVKGGEILVEALASLAPELPQASFVLAGPGDPPPNLAALMAAHPNVSWRGWLDEAAKRAALSSHPIFVLPSTSEGLPVALLEAMAWRRAIVATRVGGVPEVLADGSEALIVPAGDAAALADGMRKLVEDPARCERLGEAARARAAALNEDEVCGRLEALYRELAR